MGQSDKDQVVCCARINVLRYSLKHARYIDADFVKTIGVKFFNALSISLVSVV